MGYVGSRSRSQGQIIAKPCEHNRGDIFGPIFMKLDQNVHLNELEVKFEYGSCGVKFKVTRSNNRKTL